MNTFTLKMTLLMLASTVVTLDMMADVVKFTDLPVIYDYKDGKDGVDAGYVALSFTIPELVGRKLPYIKAPDKELADTTNPVIKDSGIFGFVRCKGSYQNKNDSLRSLNAEYKRTVYPIEEKNEFLIFVPAGLELRKFHSYFVSCQWYDCKNNTWLNSMDIKGFHRHILDIVRNTLKVRFPPLVQPAGANSLHMRVLGYVEPYRAELEKAFETWKLKEAQKNPQQ